MAESDLNVSGSLIGVQRKTTEKMYELYPLHFGALVLALGSICLGLGGFKRMYT